MPLPLQNRLPSIVSVKRPVLHGVFGALTKSLVHVRQLREAQWWEKSQVQQTQWQLLTDLVSHAISHVPYYDDVLADTELARGGILSAAEFVTMPLLDKEILSERFESLKANDTRRVKQQVNTSGGSTGTPARFLQDSEFYDWSRGVKIFFDEWTGYRLADRRAILWGAERDLLDGRRDVRKQARDWLTNSLLLNSFSMGAEEMERYLVNIEEFKPTQILAYAESIYELARYAESQRRHISSPPVAVMSTAGTLTAEMRRTIEQVFRCPVFNRYGSREAGDIACECFERQGLHVSPLTHYLEILDERGEPVRAGEIGEIVVTVLRNYSMPLIRYRIGDMATWALEPCSCGREWPLLGRVAGRVSDHFATSDGRLVHGEFFTHLMYHRSWARKFRFIQQAFDLVELKVQLAPGYDPTDQVILADLHEIKADVRRALSDTAQLQTTFVDSLKPTGSGKFRYTISHCRLRA